MYLACTLMDKSYEITSRNIGPDISKASGSFIRTDIFSNPHYENISAVLFSNVDAANSTEAVGYDFIAVHNPSTCKPLPNDFLNFGCDFGAKLSRAKSHYPQKTGKERPNNSP
jgi:hypothetical protein